MMFAVGEKEKVNVQCNLSRSAYLSGLVMLIWKIAKAVGQSLRNRFVRQGIFLEFSAFEFLRII